MKLFIILLFSWKLYALDAGKRLEEELNYLKNRKTFLYLPKKEILFEKTDEIKTTSSAILKPATEETQEELLKDLEEDLGFKVGPINAPQTY